MYKPFFSLLLFSFLSLHATEKTPSELFLLANKHYSSKQYELALSCYEKRVKMEGPTEETFNCLLSIAKIQEILHFPYEEVYQSYIRASQNKPERIEPLFYLSQYLIKQDQLILAYLLSKQAKELPFYNQTPHSERFIYEYGINYLVACTALALQKHEEAIPLFRDLILHPKLPITIKSASETSLLRCLKHTSSLQKTIAIFTPFFQESSVWDPNSIDSGISGSEEAVIYMSQELANLGYQVIVFGNPPENSSHSNPLSNPRYVSLETSFQDPFDIAIAWRLPFHSVDLKKRALKLFLWPHDTWTIPLSEVEINNFDGVLWLSNWQRKQWISNNHGFEQFHQVFGNGILPEQFNNIQERKNPYSCIYASNYGRGLQQLLDLWPSIKQQFPKATLDIYYGWGHFGLLTPKQEASMKQQIKKLETLSVFEHGKVGHKQLAEAFENASFWTYPCDAPETFCITALKAQIAGAIPIIIKQTALKETCPHGFSCETKEEYINTLVCALQNVDSISLEDRKRMKEFVLQNYSWKKIALEWHSVFLSQP